MSNFLSLLSVLIYSVVLLMLGVLGALAAYIIILGFLWILPKFYDNGYKPLRSRPFQVKMGILTRKLVINFSSD